MRGDRGGGGGGLKKSEISVLHLTRASSDRLVCTVGQAIRVWDAQSLPSKETLPQEDTDWLGCMSPLAQFHAVGLDCDSVKSLIFDNDEGKNEGIL
jgi:hypothetical protein